MFKKRNLVILLLIQVFFLTNTIFLFAFQNKDVLAVSSIFTKKSNKLEELIKSSKMRYIADNGVIKTVNNLQDYQRLQEQGYGLTENGYLQRGLIAGAKNGYFEAEDLLDFKAHEGEVQQLAKYNKDIIISCGSDKTLKIWNLSTGKCEKAIKYYENITKFMVLEDGTILTGNDKGYIKFWDINSDEPIIEKKVEDDAKITSLGQFKDGPIIVGLDSGYIKIFNRSLIELIKIKAHESSVKASIGLDNYKFASAGEDGQIRIWAYDYSCEREYKQYRKNRLIDLIELEYGDRKLLSLGEDGTILLWRTKFNSGNEKVVKSKFNVKDSSCMVELPDTNPRTIVVGNNSGEIMLYDRKKGVLIESYKVFDNGVVSLINLNEGVVAAGSKDGKVIIWDFGIAEASGKVSKFTKKKCKRRKSDNLNIIKNMDLAVKDVKHYKDASQEKEDEARRIAKQIKAFFVSGNKYFEQGDYEDAIKDYSEIINKIKPEFVPAYNQRANAYLALGKYEEAESDYIKGLELNDKFSILHYNLGNIYFVTGEYDKAEKLYNKAIEIEDDEPEYYNTRGELYLEIDKIEFAQKDFEKSLHLSKPDDRYKKFKEANLACSLGNYREALELYDNALDDKMSKTRLVNYFFVRGRIFEKLEEYEDAAVNYKNVLNMNKHYAPAIKALERVKEKIPTINAFGSEVQDNAEKWAKQLEDSITGISDQGAMFEALQELDKILYKRNIEKSGIKNPLPVLNILINSAFETAIRPEIRVRRKILNIARVYLYMYAYQVIDKRAEESKSKKRDLSSMQQEIDEVRKNLLDKIKKGRKLIVTDKGQESGYKYELDIFEATVEVLLDLERIDKFKKQMKKAAKHGFMSIGIGIYYSNKSMAIGLQRSVFSLISSSGISMPFSLPMDFSGEEVRDNDLGEQYGKKAFKHIKSVYHVERKLIKMLKDTKKMLWLLDVWDVYNSIHSAKRSKDILIEDLQKSLYENQGSNWHILYTGVEALYHVIKQGETKAIRDMAFNGNGEELPGLKYFVEYDKGKEGWRIREKAVEALYLLYDHEDEDIRTQAQDLIIKRKIQEKDKTVRAALENEKAIFELQNELAGEWAGPETRRKQMVEKQTQEIKDSLKQAWDSSKEDVKNMLDAQKDDILNLKKLLQQTIQSNSGNRSQLEQDIKDGEKDFEEKLNNTVNLGKELGVITDFVSGIKDELEKQSQKLDKIEEKLDDVGENIAEIKKAVKGDSNDLILKIKAHADNYAEENKSYFEEITKLYVDLKAKPKKEDPDSTSFSLKEKIDSFMNADKKVFLLSGQGGGGKTVFAERLEKELWDRWDKLPEDERKESAYIPLIVPLTSLKDPIKSLIKETFLNIGISEDKIADLRQNYKFIFVLDGYDELKEEDQKNLYDTNNFSSWVKSKVIFTCRDENLKGDYINSFCPKGKKEDFEQAHIIGFNPDQIKNYLTRYIQYNQLDNSIKWSLDQYLEYIENISGLKELARTPIVLKMIAEVLPGIVENHKKYQPEKRLEVTRKKLYESFMETWFERERLKLSQAGEDSDEEMIENFWHYAQELAWNMVKDGKTDFSKFKKKKTKSEISYWDKIFLDSEKYSITEKHRCFHAMPLRILRDGTYIFWHLSLRDFFANRKTEEDIKNMTPFPSLSQAKEDLNFITPENIPQEINITIDAAQTSIASNNWNNQLNKGEITLSQSFIKFIQTNLNKIQYDDAVSVTLNTELTQINQQKLNGKKYSIDIDEEKFKDFEINTLLYSWINIPKPKLQNYKFALESYWQYLIDQNYKDKEIHQEGVESYLAILEYVINNHEALGGIIDNTEVLLTLETIKGSKVEMINDDQIGNVKRLAAA